MASNITIKIDTARYQSPTEDDILEAKNYVIRRESMAMVLTDKIDEVLKDLAEKVVTICYRYNVNPKTFTITSSYNADMMAEISAEMDDAEEHIMALIDEYATLCEDDEQRKRLLWVWIASLGRSSRNLSDTLENYMYKFMRDIEAAVAALRYANKDMATAITTVKTYLHQIYNIPEVRATFSRSTIFNAIYIRSKGINPGGVGLSNNGSTNITNMAKITLEMAWMRALRQSYEQRDGIAGYYVIRGSDYPCDLCDSKCYFHPISDTDGFPPYHGNCCCVAIPIFNVKE